MAQLELSILEEMNKNKSLLSSRELGLALNAMKLIKLSKVDISESELSFGAIAAGLEKESPVTFKGFSGLGWEEQMNDWYLEKINSTLKETPSSASTVLNAYAFMVKNYKYSNIDSLKHMSALNENLKNSSEWSNLPQNLKDETADSQYRILEHLIKMQFDNKTITTQNDIQSMQKMLSTLKDLRSSNTQQEERIKIIEENINKLMMASKFSQTTVNLAQQHNSFDATKVKPAYPSQDHLTPHWAKQTEFEQKNIDETARGIDSNTKLESSEGEKLPITEVKNRILSINPSDDKAMGSTFRVNVNEKPPGLELTYEKITKMTMSDSNEPSMLKSKPKAFATYNSDEGSIKPIKYDDIKTNKESYKFSMLAASKTFPNGISCYAPKESDRKLMLEVYNELIASKELSSTVVLEFIESPVPKQKLK